MLFIYYIKKYILYVVLFMVKSSNNDIRTELVFQNRDYRVPLDHKARFFVEIMDEFLDELGIDNSSEKAGRTPYNVHSMLKLIVYAKMNHITTSEEIEDLALYHDVYAYVCDYITPSARSIRRYKKENKGIYNNLLKLTLNMAEKKGLTSFNHVPIDGTIKKAYNNIHNNINEKETDILLRFFEGDLIEEEILEELTRPAKKFMNNKKLDDEDKINVLKQIKEQFTKTEQEKIPLNDIEARKMKGKRGNYKIAYNVQSAVDSESKLICAITVSQNPTDHKELPKIADKAIKNIGKKPKYISADTIYLNSTSLIYGVKTGIELLIPCRKQAKEDSNRLHKNPFHKDHFEYDISKDAFKCPEGQYLYFYKEYVKPNENKEKEDKITRLYRNYEACKNCKQKNKCFKESQSHRIISENGNRLQRQMYLKMEKEEYRKESAKRSSVEGPYGPFKIYYNMEDEVVIGIEDTEDFMTLNAVAYNLNRLYKLLYKSREKNSAQDNKKLNITNTLQSNLDSIYS